jgi:hypothetical protein
MKVQQALNLSEIEDTFLKASRNYSQKREDSLSHETNTLGRGMLNIVTPETAPAYVNAHLLDHTPLGGI